MSTAAGRKAICLSRTTTFSCSPNTVSEDCTLRLGSPKSLREDNDFWSRYAWLRVQCVTSGCTVLNLLRLRGSRVVREDLACRHRKAQEKAPCVTLPMPPQTRAVIGGKAGLCLFCFLRQHARESRHTQGAGNLWGVTAVS